MTNDHITQPVNMVHDPCNHVWSDPDIMDEGEYQVKISVCIHCGELDIDPVTPDDDPIGYDKYPEYPGEFSEENFTDCGQFPHTSGVYLCLDAGTEWCSFHCPFSKMLEEPIADADKPYMQPHPFELPPGDVPF